MVTVFIGGITDGNCSVSFSGSPKVLNISCVPEVLEFRTTISNQQGQSLFDEYHKQGSVFHLNRFQKFRD